MKRSETPIYTTYAPFYDGSGQVRFTLLMTHYLHEVLARHPAPATTLLDVACGTGTLAVALADDGWDVTGLDAAAPMLEQARAKAAALDMPGTAIFVQGDMRAFDLPPDAFALATCFYDSLNYLLDERELAACFACVARVLQPDGMFIFDMNTRHFLEHDWEPVLVQEYPGFVQVARSHFDAPTSQSVMHLTGFSGDDERGYVRFDETHTERAYPPATITRLLDEAGLREEACYDCFTFQPPYAASQRLLWVARRTERI